MGTRSRIGIELEDGTIKSVYCHWDGYPSHNGKVLKEYYNNAKKAHELINMGDIFSLQKKIGGKHNFMNRPDDESTFFHRDRNDPWDEVQPEKSDSQEEFLNLTHRTHGEYAYLFINGEWYFTPFHEVPPFRRLTPKDTEDD